MKQWISKLTTAGSIKWLTKILVSAALFYLFGRTYSVMISPLGQFIGLWIPAGAALACVTIFNTPGILGVFIGALLINMEVLAPQNPNGWVAAILFAVLASAQAVTALRLIKFSGKVFPPKTLPDTFIIALILGINTIVYSVLGTLLLQRFNFELPLPAVSFGGAWWLEAMVSLLVIAPVIVIIYQKSWKKNQNQYFLWLLSSLFLGFMLTLVYFSWKMEMAQIRLKVRDEATDLISLINIHLREETSSVLGIKSFFNSSDVVERDEFQNYTNEYLSSLRSTISFAWLPKVRSQDLEEFEQIARDEYLEDYSVYNIEADGNKVKPDPNGDLFPIYYYESAIATNDVYGYNLNSNPVFQKTLAAAFTTNEAVVSEPLSMKEINSGDISIAIAVPIFFQDYEFNKSNPNQDKLLGYCVGFFDMNELINTALANSGGVKIKIYIYDITDETSVKFIGAFDENTQKGSGQISTPPTLESLEDDYNYLQETEFFGRKWLLAAVPTQAHIASINPHYSWILFAFTFFTCAVLFTYVHSRQKNEALLRKSESMFRSLSDSARTGIIRINRAGGILYANDAMIQMLGYESLEEFKQTNFYSLFNDPETVKNKITSKANGESIVNHEMIIFQKNHQTRNILLSAGFLEDLISANIVDVTDLLKLNKEVGELDHAIQQMADSVVITNSEGVIEYSNPTFETALGLQSGSVIGKNISEVITKFFPSFNSKNFWNAVTHKSSYEFEFALNKPDGKVVHEIVTLSPIRNSKDEVIQVVGTGKDITDLKTAEEEIRTLNASLERKVQERTAELEKANQELEAFSYSVSHDLRAPLRGMQGYSTLLLEDYYEKLDSTAINYLRNIKTSTQKMDSLIEELLKLSRLGKTRLNKKKVDLAAQALEIVTALREEYPNRKVAVTLPNHLYVFADAQLIYVALNNLIRNAWKFTGKKEDSIIELGSRQNGNETEYFVRDNGTGFEMKFADKLFGIFQRLHSEEEFEGIGIGLVTVKRIINHHGGRVWAEGEPGKGATFYFTLAENEEGHI